MDLWKDTRIQTKNKEKMVCRELMKCVNQEKSKKIKSRSSMYDTELIKSYCAQTGNVNVYVLFSSTD